MPFRFILAGLLLIVAGYGFVKATPLLTGPEIRIDPLVATADTGFMTLSGRALHTETLTLDGGTLLIDENGHFSKTLVLPRGAAELTLRATDRFGRSKSETKTVIAP
jgi:hypothetical protein